MTRTDDQLLPSFGHSPVAQCTGVYCSDGMLYPAPVESNEEENVIKKGGQGALC